MTDTPTEWFPPRARDRTCNPGTRPAPESSRRRCGPRPGARPTHVTGLGTFLLTEGERSGPEAQRQPNSFRSLSYNGPSPPPPATPKQGPGARPAAPVGTEGVRRKGPETPHGAGGGRRGETRCAPVSAAGAARPPGPRPHRAPLLPGDFRPLRPRARRPPVTAAAPLRGRPPRPGPRNFHHFRCFVHKPRCPEDAPRGDRPAGHPLASCQRGRGRRALQAPRPSRRPGRGPGPRRPRPPGPCPAPARRRQVRGGPSRGPPP